MKKFLIGLLLVILLILGLGLGGGYFYYKSKTTGDPPVVEVSSEAQEELKGLTEKLQDKALKTKDGAEVNVEDLITEDENGNITPDLEQIKNLDPSTIEDVANTLSPEDVEALKNEVMTNPELMMQAMDLLSSMKK